MFDTLADDAKQDLDFTFARYADGLGLVAGPSDREQHAVQARRDTTPTPFFWRRMAHRGSPARIGGPTKFQARILTGLGWNTSDPREVTRRPVETSSAFFVLLSIAGSRSIQIIVCDMHAAESVEEFEPDVGWVVVTNGVGWRVRRGSDTAFVESFSLSNRNAGERLQELLSKRSHSFGLVSRHDLRRRLSVLVDAEIAKAIDRSPDLEASLLEQLPRLANGGMALGELLGELLPPVDADPVRRMPPPRSLRAHIARVGAVARSELPGRRCRLA